MRILDSLPDAGDRWAIERDLDSTLVVEAAAGTGKTTELVNRIVGVLAEGRAEVREIVAVTFTEKAAGELKLRLREALDRARLPGGVNAARGRRLEEALAHLEEAHVSTIHGFCAELIRERPVEAGVDPRFEVLLEPQARRLYRRAFDAWLEEALQDPPEGVRRALRRYAAGEGGPRARLSEAGWTLAEWRDFPAAWRRDPFDRDQRLTLLMRQLHEFADLSAHPARPNDTLYLDTGPARTLSDRATALQAAGRDDPDGLEAALIDLTFNTAFARPRKGYGTQYGNHVARTAVQQAHASLVEALLAFRRDADADLAVLLQGELSEAVGRYERLKAQSGSLDFVDLLLRARDLVRGHEDVRACFQARFARIFVDEFQDTDPLQAELLLLLAADDPRATDWTRVRPVPGKLFIVGDPKQSIYRFRRADVGVYQAVREQLLAHGARPVRLQTSFRSLPSIQNVINATFSAEMHEDRATLQAGYVPLKPYRREPEPSRQPSIVALPVPRPYGTRRISAKAIDESLPQAVAAFIAWLLEESGWNVFQREEDWRDGGGRTVAGGGTERRLQARDICVLFRRFQSWDTDVTRAYLDALQARGIAHLLVGGRSFHDRDEVEAMRAAFAAIEWPDDELSVFATLHGPLFALPDEALIEYRALARRLHPFRLPSGPLPEPLAPVVDALAVLRDLHKARNEVPVTETIERLLGATRAHAGLVLRRSGEQALANVLQLAELARMYEASGDALSFRGFLDLLDEEAEAGESAEAPILEEGAEGVRLMTVHRAKGLEFPVVVLADMTANLAHGHASRYLDATRRLCAVRIAGWSPPELLEHDAEEVARDRAEAVRVAYVAATRARDLLVVPAVGDRPYDDKWLSALNRAIYPPGPARRAAETAPGCPPFGKDSVLERPDGDPAASDTVSPGLHRFPAGPGDADASLPEAGPYAVAWWDPAALALDAPSSFGIREEDLIGRHADEALVQADTTDYETWRAERQSAIERGRIPTVSVETATSHAARRDVSAAGQVDVIDLHGPRDGPEAASGGARLGTLTHAALASVALDADARAIDRVVALHARVLGATADERRAAADKVASALAHPLLERARAAERNGRCRREAPVTLVRSDGTLVEGVVDLAFDEGPVERPAEAAHGFSPATCGLGWTVIDFKTDREMRRGVEIYQRQVALYAEAIARATGRPARGVLMHL